MSAMPRMTGSSLMPCYNILITSNTTYIIFSLIPSAYQPYPLLWQINITCTKQLLAVQQHHMLFFQTNLNLSSIFYAGDNAQHFTLGTLRKVLKVLLAAARVLPEDEVPYTVARRLFGLEQFVDFEASDPATRSHLLSAAFELLDVAWQRSIPVGFLPYLQTPNPDILQMSMPESADVKIHWCPALPTRIPGSVLSVLYVKRMSASWGLQMEVRALNIANF